MYASGLADTWHTTDDDVRHVAIFCDDLETFYCLIVANYVVKKVWTVFLDPANALVQFMHNLIRPSCHGNS